MFDEVPEDMRTAETADLRRLADKCDRLRFRILTEIQRREMGDDRTAVNERIDGMPKWAQNTAKSLLGASKTSIFLLSLAIAVACAARACQNPMTDFQKRLERTVEEQRRLQSIGDQ